MANMDIRFKARAAGVPLWKIAKELGISEPTIQRRLRKEMKREEKEVYFNAIKKIVTEQAKSVLDRKE